MKNTEKKNPEAARPNVVDLFFAAEQKPIRVGFIKDVPIAGRGAKHMYRLGFDTVSIDFDGTLVTLRDRDGFVTRVPVYNVAYVEFAQEGEKK